MSADKRVYRVVGSPGPYQACSLECSRKSDLTVTLIAKSDATGALGEFGSPEFAASVANAFATGFVPGLLNLAFTSTNWRLPASLTYLREFGKAMLTHWVLTERATGVRPGRPPEGLIEVWVQVAHENRALENLNGGVLYKIWERVREALVEVLTGGRTLVDYLAMSDPMWTRVGSIVLRLDDVMEDPARPFMLLSSYYDSITAAKCGVTTSLAVPVFGECRVTGLRRYLYELLRKAGTSNGVVRRLFESQEIFSPCYLIPRDAHALVRDKAAIEALGIEVILPRWWKNLKQPEIRVRTRIGAHAPKSIGVDTLLDLHTSYIVGDHELTEAEWRHFVRNQHEGLTRIGNEWVDLLRARIDAAIFASRRIAELKAAGGVTYARALELTAARLPGDETIQNAPSPPDVTFEPGEWLRDAFTAIERRDFRRSAEPDVRLRSTLFSFQRQGLAWLSMLMDVGAGACLADDMGLGKTIQVISLIMALVRRGDPGPHMIVVPASLLTNWQQEFERFAGSLELGVVHGSDVRANDPVPLVTLTSYGTLSRREVLQQRRWGLVVLDEAQEIMNPHLQLTHVVKRLQTRMRICLTGTPIENSLTDLWSIMDFLNPGLLGSEPEFRQWCKEQLAGDDGLAPLRRRVRPFILRRLKTDPEVALDLPRKVEVTVYCGMTPLQSNLYGQIYAEMLTEFSASTAKKRQGFAFKVLLRLKQICDHPGFGLDRRFDPQSSGKFLRLAEIARMIAERGEKVLVFTQFQEMTTPIAAHLEQVMQHRGAILDGQTPMRRRQELVAEFQTEGGPSFLVLTFGVGGTGFNLTAACHVVLFDRWWNPAVESQAMDRAFRIGQTKGVVVHKFLCRGTLEERIDLLIQRKQELAKAVFADDADPDAALGKLSPDELLSLAALDPTLAGIDEQ